jgi:protein-tyrosine-phosphatase
MGASSSIVGNVHIHISLSTKFNDDGNMAKTIIEKLESQNVKITKTDPNQTTEQICNTIKKCDLVIYCSTQAYGTCSTQAIEYSYLMENDKKRYELIIDSYKGNFTQYIQGFLQGEGWEMSSLDDIPRIIRSINDRLVC